MGRPGPDILMRIRSVEDETDSGVCVVLEESGKRAWLPKRELEYLPGAVVVPGWLAKKMNREGREGGVGRRWQ